MTWQEMAKRIPAWRGMRDVRGFFVVGKGAQGSWRISDPELAWSHSMEVIPVHRQEREENLAPDLAHAQTAREAVAQLALFLGAPAEAVEVGVRFYYLSHGWILDAGHGEKWSPAWSCAPVLARSAPPGDRPLAIATAWCEALDAAPRPGALQGWVKMHPLNMATGEPSPSVFVYYRLADEYMARTYDDMLNAPAPVKE